MTALAKPVALVPGVLALLPEYASIYDPVAEIRAACLSAVVRLGPRVRVVSSFATGGSGRRVGEELVAAAGAEVVASDETGVLVVANGSATRTEKAPGHFDPRAEAFDAALRADLTSGDAALAAELWADVEALAELSALGARSDVAEVLYDEAPYGVQYWVLSWSPAHA